MNLEIANRLLQLRKENRLSQEELAEKIGVSRQAVSKWERAEASPDTDNLILLARLYNVSIDDLLKTEEPIEPTDSIDTCSEDSNMKPDLEDKEQAGNSLWLRFPVPLVVVVIYLAIGYFSNKWHPAWLIFITIPIYYWIVTGALRHRNK